MVSRHVPFALALAAAIVTVAPATRASTPDRRCSTQQQIFKTMRVVIESYRVDKGRYPGTLDEARIGDIRDAWRRPPKYRLGADRLSYTLRSAGPDGRDDTFDDVVATRDGIVAHCFDIPPVEVQPGAVALQPRSNSASVAILLALGVAAAAALFAVHTEARS